MCNPDKIMPSHVCSLTAFINKSPLAEGKKQLAMRQAGNYDAAATRAQIDRYVNDNAVRLSSVTSLLNLRRNI